uniref:Rho GTPase-activating protein 23 n=1 Tax=Callorhinchus milii TaxID=7868 RepID=A0A4W3JXU3_CALMI
VQRFGLVDNLSLLSPNQNANEVQDEVFSWPGPKTVLLQKNTQGFGFTLRHFIVYPPESAVHSNLKVCIVGQEKGKVEPMDTIFVKSVKEGGPAHQAGLCTGDRIVKVNGESIIGKTYSQVIALIQNSSKILELSVMPKDEDILQVAYSQDAYLKGNDPYSGSACHIPEPPPVCYPRQIFTHSAMTQTKQPLLNESSQGRQIDNRIYNTGSDRGFYSDPSSPLESAPTTSPPASVWGEGRTRTRSADILAEVGVSHSGPVHHSEEIPYGTKPQRSVPVRGRSVSSTSNITPGSSVMQNPISSNYISVTSAMQERYGRPSKNVSTVTNHGVYMGPKSNKDPRNCISSKDTRANDHFHSDRIKVTWEHLAPSKAIGKRAGDYQYNPPSWRSAQLPRRSSSQDRSYSDLAPKYKSYSQDRLEETSLHKHWPHSASQDTLLSPVGDSWSYRTHSEDYLEQCGRSMESLTANTSGGGWIWPNSRSGGTSEGVHRSGVSEQMLRQQYRQAGDPLLRGQKQSHTSLQNSNDLNAPCKNANSRMFSPPQQHYKNDAVPAHSVKRAHIAPAGQLSVSVNQGKIYVANRTASGFVPAATVARADKCSPAQVQRIDVPAVQDQRLTNHDRQGILYLKQVDKTSGRATHHQDTRQFAVTKTAAGVSEITECASEISPGFSHKEQEQTHTNEAVILRQKPPTGRRVPQPLRHPSYMIAVDLPEPLLSADSPGQSPVEQTKMKATDLKSSEDSLASIPYIDEPTSPSIDLVADHVPASAVVSSGHNSAPRIITSPASPTFAFPLPRHYSQDCSKLRSLDSLDTSEDTRTKRHSTSDLCDVTFSDVRKEGWLHFRQLVAEKGKRIVSSIRPWKRVYALLRSHSLYLYKDKRDAVSASSSQADDEQPICIKACLIDISYSETKRKNVFRLTTSDFCDYLFQAEDRDDMLNWIKIIQENSKTEGEVSTVFIKNIKYSSREKGYSTVPGLYYKMQVSLDFALLGWRITFCLPVFCTDESSPPKDKTSWLNIIKKAKKPVLGAAFGVRLEDCQHGVNNKFIPLIVEICCKLVEEKGLEYTGIYRVPGNNAMVSSLQEQLNKGTTDLNTSEEKWQDLNVISSLLKLFFRKLPEPLFTDDKYGDFIEANRLEDSAERLQTFKKLLRNLPEHYYETLKFLTGHLKTVADHSEKNKMEPRNLALVFGPTLVRTSEDNMIDMVTHMQDRYKIIETLIQHYEWFFSEDQDKDEEVSYGNTDLQPVPNIDHLLSNIGRTGGAPGDISDSTTSDSAKSKGSWGSRKDLYSRELLVISIFASVNRKRKKQKEAKVPESSTDDDSEHEPIKEAASSRSVVLEQFHQSIADKEDHKLVGETGHSKQPCRRVCRGEAGDVANQNSLSSSLLSPSSAGPEGLFKDGASPKSLNSDPSNGSGDKLAVTSPPSQSASDSHSKRNRFRLWRSAEVEHRESLPTDASSIVSGYSTISSTVTTLDHTLSSEVQSIAESRGDEADDERSELVSDGGHIETDNESGYQTRPLPGKASRCSQQPKGRPGRRESDSNASSDKEGSVTQKLSCRPTFNSHRLIQCDTLARKKLSKPKGDWDSKLKLKEEKEPPKASLMLENANNPTSTTSRDLHKNENDKEDSTQTSKRTLADHVKLRLKTSADDMFGVGLRKQSSPETRRKKNIRRRHTVVVQNDLPELNFREWKEKQPESKNAGHSGGKTPAVDQFRHRVESSISGRIAQPVTGTETCTTDLSHVSQPHTGGPHQSGKAMAGSVSASITNSSGRRSASSSSSSSSSGLSAAPPSGPGKDRDPDSNSTKSPTDTKAPKHTASSRFHQYL